MRVLLLALLLSGCSTKALTDYDESLLEKCGTAPVLSGLDGQSIMLWAEKAGPMITNCFRNHDALVDIIKAKGP